MTLWNKLRSVWRAFWRLVFPLPPDPFDYSTLFGDDRLLPDSDLEELRLVDEWLRWGRFMELFAWECEQLLDARSVFRTAGPFVEEEVSA